MLKASKRSGASIVVATAALSLFALHCSSEDPPPAGTGGTGNVSGSAAGGTAAGGSAAGGSGTSGSSVGGTATGGGGTGGSAAGGGGAGGTGGGTGGSGGAGGTGGGTGGSGGSGGTGGGTGGSGGSGGSGGGSTATFAQVKTILSGSCAGNMCHSEPSTHIDWVTENGLYERLTTAIGNKGVHCKGSIPVIKNMPNDSLLVQILKGGNPTACKAEGGGSENVDRMPNNCGNGPTQCLSDAQIKTISDWIAAGAPQ